MGQRSCADTSPRPRTAHVYPCSRPRTARAHTNLGGLLACCTYTIKRAARAPLIGYQAARNICLNQACWPSPNLLTLPALSAGCQAARNICCGEDAAGLARKQRAVAARVPYVSVDLPAIGLGL